MPCKTRYIIVAIAALCYISRIPILLSPQLFLDGDECVVGLMSRHIYEGKGFPIFFWGQQYGITIIETITIMPFYAVLGFTTLAVKLGILTVWITGTIFLYKTIFALTGHRQGLSVALIMLYIVMPPWIVWSMKAYATPYLLSNIMLFLLVERHKKNYSLYVLIGVLGLLIYETQMLWLVGVFPFLLYRLWVDRSVKKTLMMIVPVIIGFMLLNWYKQSLPETHVMAVIPPRLNNLSWYFTRFPKYLYGSLHGDYYFNQYARPYFFNGLLSVVLSILVYALFLSGIYKAFSFKRKDLLFIASVLFIPLCFVYTLFTHTMEGRYLLPISGYLFVAISIYLKEYNIPKTGRAVFGLLIAAGFISCIGFYNYCEVSGDYKKSVFGTIRFLNQNNIHYTYSTDCMLPYQVMFYSDLKIFSRMPYQPSRYQPYSDSVDIALGNGKNTAVIGIGNVYMGMDMKIDTTLGRMFIAKNVPIDTLKKAFDIKQFR